MRGRESGAGRRKEEGRVMERRGEGITEGGGKGRKDSRNGVKERKRGNERGRRRVEREGKREEEEGRKWGRG